ncbi:MAG: ketoacyl-ACP synthase III [bacterium]|nr:ketoacyl-ACP synthase III [bacterium]
MSYVAITGVGSCLPKRQVTNDDLVARGVDTSDDWIRDRSGIGARHIVSEGESTLTLAVGAGRMALANAGVAPEDIGVVIVATSTQEYAGFPSTACLVQHELGIGSVPAFDMAAACTGFNYALTTAHHFITGGPAKHALVIAADALSSIINWADRGTCVLFGDGAGAVVLSASDSPGILSEQLYSDGSLGDILKVDQGEPRETFEGTHDALAPYVFMEGRKVFKVAVESIVKSVTHCLLDAGITADDLTHVVFHQANQRIMSVVGDKLNIAPEKLAMTIEKYGNTSAASIPITLDDLNKQGALKAGDLVLMVGFGGGFTWATTLVKWTKS